MKKGVKYALCSAASVCISLAIVITPLTVIGEGSDNEITASEEVQTTEVSKDETEEADLEATDTALTEDETTTEDEIKTIEDEEAPLAGERRHRTPFIWAWCAIVAIFISAMTTYKLDVSSRINKKK
ncbi:MAG: hypothetical protein K6F66_08175 [Pseudobutyrivibrio sp.]|nr:hypothetical protein [Pseudobutyrivibrio sp.]